MMILFESANFSRVFFAVGSQGTVVLVLEVIHLLVQSFQVLRYIDPCGFWCDERTGCLIFHIIVLFRVKAEKRLPYPVSRNSDRYLTPKSQKSTWEGSRIFLSMGIKKAQTKKSSIYRAHRNKYQLITVSHCKYGDLFWECKKKAEFFTPFYFITSFRSANAKMRIIFVMSK